MTKTELEDRVVTLERQVTEQTAMISDKDSRYDGLFDKANTSALSGDSPTTLIITERPTAAVEPKGRSRIARIWFSN